MKLKIDKNTFWVFVSTFLFKGVLDLAYYAIAARLGDYIGLVEISFDPEKFIESYALLAIILVFLPKRYDRISNIAIWLLFLLSYVPMLTLYAFMDKPRAYMYGVSFFWGVLLLTRAILLRFIVLTLKSAQSRTLRAVFFVLFSLVAIALIFLYVGFSFNIDLNKVYDIRAEFVKNKIPLSGYLVNWLAYIVNPVFFVIFLKKKKWLAALFVCFTQFAAFSATGNKTYLFALPFVLGLTWFIRRKNPLAWMAAGLTSVVLAGILTFLISNNSWTYFLFTRRLMFVPAQLSFFYYDFFSQQQPLLLAQHSFFKNIVQYPYELDPPHLIADKYFGKPAANANNGIYADAYMNFHNAGFIIWGFALAVLFILFDSFSNKKDKKTAFSTLAMPSIVLCETFFLTALITHGILFSLLLLYLLPTEDEEKK